MFVLSLVLMSFSAALLAFSGLRGHASFLRLTAFGAGVAALFLLNATALGFSLN
jgi:hypothetical protein